MVASTQTNLLRFVNAFTEDQLTALQALSVLRLFSAGSSAGAEKTLHSNNFLTSVHRCAHEALMISVWRMYDDNSTTCAGIVGICEYAKKNPQECTWLHSKEGLAEFPRGSAEVTELADQWLAWHKNLPFSKQLLMLRHNYVGHRAMSPVLGKHPTLNIKWSDVSEAIFQAGEFINAFRKLTDNTSVYTQNVYEQSINDGAFTIALAETKHREVVDNPDQNADFTDLWTAIQEADAKQVAENNWNI